MKRLLLVSYFYPPLGGPGVQRPLKLIKYLSESGWETDVITVEDIVFHSYDNKLAAENKARKVFRIPSYDPMSILKKTKPKEKKIKNIYFGTPEKIKKIIRNLFPIDDKIGWLPNVMKSSKKIFKENKYDAVMATMGPYTSGLIAFKLSQKYDLPLILDYRDHWTLNPYIKYSNLLLSKHAKKWEKKILNRAEVVTTVGDVIRQDLISEFGKDLSDKILVMYNGWDEDDFPQKIKPKNNKIILRYVGNFYGHRSVKYLIKAVEKLDNSILKKIKIQLIGNYFKETLETIQKSSCNELFDIKEQVDHSTAVMLMKTSDILLLFIASPNGKGVLTGKIFEYIRSERPIFAMIPPKGEAADILRKLGHENICAMEDVEMITENLKQLINSTEKNKLKEYKFDPNFDREHQTRNFVEFIEKKL
ncbi:MAG: glycosyltransferase [Candidatus Cloacimonetes bacterium]|nr:glycosyltransferase [Candidatus Cloacimonadota bacterium]MCF7814857.1 glycosyltransferase [Candidatus Cloacimonadota bacterium]MCF7867516.1 glycosyltransferase [Candidatus Cloacimonadota bacterium]MCF7882982.1 glycosyltransferase [Candidatus Cloacimonadota bacterium]